MNMHLTVREVTLGEAEVDGQLAPEEVAHLSRLLQEKGFELLDDPRSCLVEAIRVAVLKWVREGNHQQKLSDYLCSSLGRDYSSLSKLFSQVRGVTIEHYAIEHRVEYGKELLCYSGLTISEVAYKLGYSSPAHFTSQFRQFTGMSPKSFRALDTCVRRSLDEI